MWQMEKKHTAAAGYDDDDAVYDKGSCNSG